MLQKFLYLVLFVVCSIKKMKKKETNTSSGSRTRNLQINFMIM